MKITKRKAGYSGFTMVGIAALLAGCAAAPEETDTGAGAGAGTGGDLDFTPCIVSDFGGFEDQSFNQSSYAGMEAAADELGVDFQEAESTSEDQYAGNVSGMVDQGCNFILTVGFALANATRDAAQANEDVQFAIIDSALSNDDFSPLELDNVKPILYDTAQAAFLAGYLAAGHSESGIVGTFGGQQFPSVTIFMDGFADGVDYYNEQKGADVQVVGWNKETQTGSFTGGFEANQTAKTTAEGLLDQGADVLLPVGGPIFQSAGEAIRDRNDSAALIGVDSDLYLTAPDFADLYLTSILKQMTDAVQEVTVNAANGEFDAEPYVGTLENDGVDIAPLHDFETEVDPALVEEVEAIKEQIISGELTVESEATPQ
ncbi:BMP family lipoprotein [Planctomonas psychrotolerans]|uniref:BMP family lipoprotein n=1 Tax=Planctomonas psychrotolerans TaxID=2528712 RepID=UPI001239ECC2|nr:BMP family ABC transporter substrate-binding protein [Planctomonas psychrotolerans]